MQNFFNINPRNRKENRKARRKKTGENRRKRREKAEFFAMSPIMAIFAKIFRAFGHAQERHPIRKTRQNDDEN